MYFHVQWEQPGHLSGKTQSNSTVSLWRYNFGVVVSVRGRNGFGAGEPHCRTSSLTGCLVDPIDQAGSEVERRKIPILEVILRVGEVSEAETPMATHVKVDATCDRPLTTETFDWLWIFFPHNWRI